jgi:hypothetical protein
VKNTLKEKLLAKLQKDLDKYQAQMDAKNKEQEEDEETSQDTEWFADYENLRGFIEGLQSAIATVKKTR